MLHRGNRCRLHRVVYLEVPAMKVTCEHIEAIVREAVGKLVAIRNAPEGAAPSQDDALAQMTKERDEWSHKANEWRRKYAELCYPGMTTEVHAASGLPGQDGPLIQELSKAKAVAPVATPAGDDSGGEYAMTFYFRNWDDLTDAHVAWVNRGDVVALGGEKGEAVAWRYSRNNGKSWHLAEQDPTELMPDSGGIVIPLFAAPVGKARMLTDEEADHITGMHNTGRSQGDSECAEAIQRKFCEVNGIELQDVQRGSKNG